jgi:hypothetical protein
MLTPATPNADLDQWEGTVRVFAELTAAADRSDPAVKQALLQDAVVLATIATDKDDHNEAPDNTRDQ